MSYQFLGSMGALSELELNAWRVSLEVTASVIKQVTPLVPTLHVLVEGDYSGYRWLAQERVAPKTEAERVNFMTELHNMKVCVFAFVDDNGVFLTRITKTNSRKNLD